MGRQNIGNHVLVDNFEELLSFIKFEDSDTFYYLQYLKRRKDGNTSKSTIMLGSRFITNTTNLDKLYEEAKSICDREFARAYLSIVPRSLEKFTKECALSYVSRICNNNYTNSFKIPNEVALYNSVAKSNEKIWVFDIDDNVDKIINYLKSKSGITILGKVETFSGIHVFVKPFNYPDVFSDMNKTKDDKFVMDGEFSFDLKKEALTILYACKEV